MLTRRKVIVRTVQSMLALGSIQFLSGCSEEADVERPPGSPLNEYALAMSGVSFIGADCIEKSGFDSSTSDSELRSTLTQRIQNLLSVTGAEGSLKQQLDGLIRNDFANGRVVDVVGWQLSETECQLVALAASLQGYRTPTKPDKTQTRIGKIVEVQDWGPKSTIQGSTFNEQPDGHSGLWFKADGAPVSVAVVVAGKSQSTQIYPDLLTSGLRGDFMEEIINTPGEYTVALHDKTRQLTQPVGTFQVLEPGMPAHNMTEADLDKCSVKSWGPRHVKAGKAFNPQPGGQSAFWLKTNCALDGSKLVFDGKELETTVRKNLLTAYVPWGHRMDPGKYALEIKLGHSERTLKAGYFRIE